MTGLQQYDYRRLVAAAEEPVWVSTDVDLARYCKQWSECPVIALDTEFIRTRTFYPIPGLIQLADQLHCYLIDPLTISNWEPLRELLVNQRVLKVLHAPSEDLELFRHSYQVVPSPLFDTQIAAAFVGWGMGAGLQRLLRTVLDVELGKEQTRSDWLQRPLTREQERYAALDVAYLVELYRRIDTELDSNGRRAWAEEEIGQQLSSTLNAEAEMDRFYQRFSQLWNLPIHRVAALRDLCVWREKTVRETDRTRNAVLSNNLIVEIMKRWPRSMKELSEIKEMRGSVVGEFGHEIMRLLYDCKASAKENPPDPIPQPLDFEWHGPVKRLRKLAHQIAQDAGLPNELLVRKRDIEALIRSGEESGEFSLPAGLSGWRAELVGQPLLAELLKIKENS